MTEAPLPQCRSIRRWAGEIDVNIPGYRDVVVYRELSWDVCSSSNWLTEAQRGQPQERLSQVLCRAGSGPLGLGQGCEDRNELPEEVRPMLTPPPM